MNKNPSLPLKSKEETLTETVILSTGTATGLPKNVETGAEKVRPSRSTEEKIRETVILKKNSTPSPTMGTIPDTHSPERENTAGEKNDVPETLILKPSYIKNKNKENE